MQESSNPLFQAQPHVPDPLPQFALIVDEQKPPIGSSKNGSVCTWRIKLLILAGLTLILVAVIIAAVLLVNSEDDPGGFEARCNSNVIPTKAPVAPRDPAVAFNIALYFLSSVSDDANQTFTAAVDRLQAVVTKDIGATVILTSGQTFCGVELTSSIAVDDLLIFASVTTIDGPGGILGQAGPCGFDSNGQVRLGQMVFDIADFSTLIADGTAQATVLHEMIHVLVSCDLLFCVFKKKLD